jgi:hypothetical protein
MSANQSSFVAVLAILLISCAAPTTRPASALTPVQTDSKTYAAQTDYIKITFQPPIPTFPTSPEVAGTKGVIKVEFTIGSDGVPVSIKATDCPTSLLPIVQEYGMKWRFQIHTTIVGASARFTLQMPYKFRK